MHKLWVEYLEDLNYKNRKKIKINFPLIEDTNGEISKTYGMLHMPTSSYRDIRGVFIIDDKNIVRSINFYPVEIGRNMQEIVRTIEALQTTQEALVYTPANWEKGDDVIVPYNPTFNAKTTDAESLQNYYKMGNRIWFKKSMKTTNNIFHRNSRVFPQFAQKVLKNIQDFLFWFIDRQFPFLAD